MVKNISSPKNSRQKKFEPLEIFERKKIYKKNPAKIFSNKKKILTKFFKRNFFLRNLFNAIFGRKKLKKTKTPNLPSYAKQSQIWCFHLFIPASEKYFHRKNFRILKTFQKKFEECKKFSKFFLRIFSTRKKF
jgi:hypothetical protein